MKMKIGWMLFAKMSFIQTFIRNKKKTKFELELQSDT